MINIIFKLSLCIIFCISFLVNHAVSDLFDSANERFHFYQKMKSYSLLHSIEFNGDDFRDILVDDLNGSENIGGGFYIPINFKNDENDDVYKGLRYSIVPENEVTHILIQLSWCIYPPFSTLDPDDKKESLVMALDGGQIRLLRYLDDEAVIMTDRYTLFPYQVVLEQQDVETVFAHILDIGVGHAAESSSNNWKDLYILANDGTISRLFLFRKPFDFLEKNVQEISPFVSYELPGLPSNFWIGNIDNDEQQKDDIFFASDGKWNIWLASTDDDGYSPDDDAQSFQFTIPDGVEKITDIVDGVGEYDLLISVESEAGSDVVGYAIEKVGLAGNRYSYQIVPISIPGKNGYGNHTRVFPYKNQNMDESFPLLFVYNSIDAANPQLNPLYIFKINPSTLPSPQLVQTINLEYTLAEYRCYIDHVALLDDLDGDGISDIMMRVMGISSDPNDSAYYFIGFAGIHADTKIVEWSVYE